MEQSTDRVVADGKFLRRGHDTFRARGVTYGSFATRADGWSFPDSAQIKKDFLAIADAGLNTVRTYTVPPADVFESCEEFGLRLFIGLDYHDWRTEPHHGRRAERRILDAGRQAVAEAMEVLTGNPTVLAVAVGNEIPVDLVRLHGTRRVQAMLSQMIADVHEADAGMLVTYVNYPTTEYLEPAGQDLYAFNVFLEEPGALHRYVNHLQVLAAEKPFLLTEFGLAGDIHGQAAQAESLAMQLGVLDEIGCAGGTVFAWTDEWAVNDVPVEGWGFGITSTDRQPKPALEVVSEWAHAEYPSSLRIAWPKVSVVVCAYNEEANIENCLTSLVRADYPELEVILCDDGSTDSTLEMAERFPFEVLALPHRGLSVARNAGLAVATGDIVAYLDADAECHPDWLFHLVLSLENRDVVATGGPNLAFDSAEFVERAVSLSPGTASEVLFSPDRAEHVPGCNMAFRRSVLEKIGGFQPAFTSAGDDVDVCWRLLDEGHSIAFTPAAQVRHHRRASVKGYLKQQIGYGSAERMLAGAHPHRFNVVGHARWAGVLYGNTRILPSLLKPVIYTGYMGTAPFQPISARRSEAAGLLATALLPLTVPVAMFGLALAFASPWWLILPLLSVVLLGFYGAAVAHGAVVGHREPRPLRLRLLVGLLHVLQPLARAWGRLTGDKIQGSEPAETEWVGDRTTWVHDLRRALETAGCSVHIGPSGAFWDLDAHRGPAVSVRIVTAVAWQWDPRHRVRYRIRWPAWALMVSGVVLGVTGIAWAWAVAASAVVWAAGAAISLGRHVDRAYARTTDGATA